MAVARVDPENNEPARFREVFAALDGVFLLIDPAELRILAGSRGAARLLGAELREIEGAELAVYCSQPADELRQLLAGVGPGRVITLPVRADSGNGRRVDPEIACFGYPPAPGLVLAVGGDAGLAVDRETQAGGELRRLERLTVFYQALNRLTRPVAGDPHTDRLIAAVIETARESLEADQAMLLRLDEENGRVVSSVRCTRKAPGVAAIPPDEQLAPWLRLSRTLRFTISALLSSDAAPHPALVEAGLAGILHGEQGVRSLIAVPGSLPGSGLRLLVFQTTTGPRKWMPEEVEFLGNLMHYLGALLQREEFQNRLQNQLQLAQNLNALLPELISAQSEPQLFERLTRGLVPMMDLDRAIVSGVDLDSMTLVSRVEALREGVPSFNPMVSYAPFKLLAEALRTESPIQISHHDAPNRHMVAGGVAEMWHRATGSKTLLLALLHEDTHPSISLTLHTTRLRRDWAQDTIDVVNNLRLMVRLVIDRIRFDTDLKRKERDLTEAQKIGRIGHWIADLRTNRYVGSSESLRSIGFRLDEVPEDSKFLKLIHPDDLPQVEEARRAALAGERDYSAIFRIRHAVSGEWRYMHSRAVLERDAAGVPVIMRGTAQDITERHVAELQIREQVGELRRRERDLTEAQKIGRIGHWIWDVRADRYIGSRESLRELGFPVDDDPSADSSFHKLLHPEDVPMIDEAIRAALAGERDYSVLYRMRHAVTGEWRHMHSRGSVERDASGAPVLMRGTAQDVTEQQVAEQRIRDHLEELRRLSGRLLTIQEEERARIARELHDESGQLLSALKIDVDWLEQRADAAALRPRLAAMRRTVDQAIESSRRLVGELRPRLLDELGLEAAVAQLATDYRQRTGSICALSFNLPESLPGPLTSHIYRIVQEALTNAIRHGGGAPIEVLAEPAEGGLLLRIRDQGRGFDPASVAMGNGLSGIRERAKLLGGHAAIRSAPGAGVSIEVVIPELSVTLNSHEKHRTR